MEDMPSQNYNEAQDDVTYDERVILNVGGIKYEVQPSLVRLSN
jgi:hypothetical protein